MLSTQNLVVSAGGMAVAVPCERVIEIAQDSRVTLTSLPAMKPPMAGTIIHRGRVVAVFDLRSILGFPTHHQEVERLRDILAARERDHIAWLDELRACCETGNAFTKAIDPHKCAFGRWYDALTATEESLDELCGGDRALRFLVRHCDGPHRAIHGIATKALELAANARLNEARAMIDAAWNNELATMKRLFAQIVDGVAQARRALYVVIDHGADRLSFIVDEVHRIVDIQPSAVQPVALAGRATRGVYVSPELGDIIVLDLDRTIAEAVPAPAA